MNTDCCPAVCAVPISVSVPGIEGAAGTDGSPGAAGTNAYTLTTADFEVPIPGSNVTVAVADSTWITVGQVLFIQGAGWFTVVSKPTTQSVLVTYVNTGINANAGATISAGAQISPGGAVPTVLPAISDYQLAGSQALTNTYAQILGAQVTLNGGTYLLMATARFDMAGATFAADRPVSAKLACTTNTVADVPNSIVGTSTGVTSTITKSLGIVAFPPVTYEATAGDVIQLQAQVGTVPTAGALNAVETSILAIPVF